MMINKILILLSLSFINFIFSPLCTMDLDCLCINNSPVEFYSSLSSSIAKKSKFDRLHDNANDYEEFFLYLGDDKFPVLCRKKIPHRLSESDILKIKTQSKAEIIKDYLNSCVFY